MRILYAALCVRLQAGGLFERQVSIYNDNEHERSGGIMAIEILAFDMDGTLFTDEKKIDPRTKDSIQRAMKAGKHIVIASGRDRTGIRAVADELQLDKGPNYLALINGQIIYDLANKEVDLDDVLTNEDARKIEEACRKFDIEGIFCCGYDFYSYVTFAGRLRKAVNTLISGKPGDYGLATGKDYRNFYQLGTKEHNFEQDINKVCMIKTASFFEKNMDALKAALPDYDLLLVGPNWLEVMPKGVSKASALEKIARKLGLSMNEVMAFGDAENDLHMISEAGIGVAMKNGMDSLKEKATLVTDTNNNNGIGRVIDALLDGKEEELRKGILPEVQEKA